MDSNETKIRMALLASGDGTNVSNFIRYFKDHPVIEVALVVSNNLDALVLSKAAKEGVAHLVIRNDQWKDKDLVMGIFTESKIDFIVLAGFLLLVPGFLIEHYQNKIVNIHPALLPGFGGKGMYGMRVHQAVIDAGEEKSGITIHQVNERYDEGETICQFSLDVKHDDTPESLARKIHQLEYKHYPKVVEKLILESL
jgi:phosphoribosylglycinamide formyltransferase 1